VTDGWNTDEPSQSRRLGVAADRIMSRIDTSEIN
jgi:hypothetical protein